MSLWRSWRERRATLDAILRGWCRDGRTAGARATTGQGNAEVLRLIAIDDDFVDSAPWPAGIGMLRSKAVLDLPRGG